MPMTAMLRSLGKISQVGPLVPGSAAEWNVVTRLGDVERLKRARVHPLQVLMAMAVYRTGHGLLGKLQWHPSPAVVDALDRAFYAAFASVEPSGKRFLIGPDASGSRGMGQVAGSPLTPREATGIAAKLVVVGLTATGFTIADPADGGMLDVVGFDASAPAVIADFVAGRL